MADQVTLSTFLELKDNITPGLSAVTKELNKTNEAATKVTATLDKMGRLRDVQGKFLKKGTEEHTAALKQLGLGAEEAAAAVGEIGDKATETGDKFQSLRELGSSLGSMFQVLGAGSLAAMVGFGKVAVDVNREFENTSIRIAGTIKAFDVAPTFDIAKKKTTEVLGTIQELAAALPGETEDYITVFAQALPKAITSGMKDVKAVADFTSRYTAVAISNTVDAQQAGMDLFRMLAGQAGADVRMWTVLAEKIGMDAKEFNKLAADVRQSKIDTAIKAFDDQLKAAGDTFDAKFGEMQSRLKEIVRLGSEPLFAGVKTILADINKRLSDNKDTLRATINLISADMLQKLRYFVDHVDEIGDKLETAYTLGKAFIGLWVASTTVSSVAGLVKGFLAIRDAVIAANAAAGAGALAKLIAFAPEIAALAALAGVVAYRGRDVGDVTFSESMRNEAVLRQAIPSETLEGLDKALNLTEQTAALVTQEIKTATGTMFPVQRSALEAQLAEFTKGKVVPGVGMVPADTLMKYAELRGLDMERVAAQAGMVPKAPIDRTQVVNDFRYSRFDIRQEFAEGFDPDRIAVAFATDLGKLADRKLASASASAGMR